MALFYFIIYFGKVILFFFHPFLSPSPVWSSTFWFFVSLLYILFQRPSIFIIVHASWALLHVKFQYVLIHSWRNFCLDIYCFSFLSFFFFWLLGFWCLFFLVSALAEASDEVTGWRKWTRGNWVENRLRPWAQNEKTWLHLVRWESKTGAQWSSEEMGGPQCTSHSGLVMPPTLNFSYYFFSTSFITLSIFFQ